MATATKERPTAAAPRLTRDQAATRLKVLLTDEPQSAASLARRLGVPDHGGDIVTNALAVLSSRAEAKRIPNTAGSKAGGWTSWDSEHEAVLAHPMEIEFPYDLEKRVPLVQMFVDQDYQRPLTTFVNRVEKRFDPILFGVLTLSDRGRKHPGGRYGLIDGQTRWVAGTRIGVPHAPAMIFSNLSPADEANLFWRIQKERRGMVSWHRFRAQLASGDPQSIEIKKIAKSVGFKLGEGVGELKAVGALEAAFKSDAFTLERVLSDYREAWPTTVPQGQHIRGLHYFFRHFPLDQKRKQDVNDERLVRRLKFVGPDELRRKALAAKEFGKGDPATFMARAIEWAYLTGGKAK